MTVGNSNSFDSKKSASLLNLIVNSLVFRVKEHNCCTGLMGENANKINS